MTWLLPAAGRTGLMLASDLRLHGVHALVLENEAEPTAYVRATGLHVRSIEVMGQRGTALLRPKRVIRQP